MANIKLAIVPVNITTYLIITVERVDDLGTVVYQHPALGPAPGNQNITVPNVPSVMLRFFFWESADGVSLDTNLGSADIDGSLAYDAIVMLYEFEVGAGGANPADLSDTYVNAELIGADLLEPGVESTSTVGVYTVEQKGAGTKFFAELTNNPLTGGFTLTGGDKFSTPDRWIVTLYKKVQSVAPTSSTGFPADLQTITAQVTVLDATYRNKELEIFSAFPVVTLTQENLAAVPDGTYLVINTHRFTGNYVFLDFAPGGGLYYDGQLLSSFWIPANAVFGFTVKSHNARALPGDGSRACERGLIIGSYSDRRGYVQAIGTEYTKAAMPGLYAYVKSLPPGVACSFADWGLLDVPSGHYFNKSRWAIDEALEKIIVPDLRNLHRRFLKLAADATRPNNQPGSLQLDNVKSHDHRVRGNFASGNYDGGGNDFFRGRSSTPYQDSDLNELTGGPENTVLNAGEIPLITL